MDLPQHILAGGMILALLFVGAPQEATEKKIVESLFPSSDQVQRGLIAEVWVTAYSSTPEETWGDPFITASGERVRDGIIATNFLPFGTEVQMPDLFGDKIFVVKDRMAKRKTNFVDIWMPSKQEAINFGIHQARIIVLDSDIAKNGLSHPYELPEFALQ